MRHCFVPALLLLLLPLSLSAQQGDSTFHPQILPSLEVQRTTGPIDVDGVLDEPAWRTAARVANFTQYSPIDKMRPPVETTALIAYDNSYLYVAFIAYDDPRMIRATLHERDVEWNEDMCGLILDTWGDGTRAYEIFVNARGVQGDLLWTAQSEDSGFDLVFDSDARITDSGYVVEMAIPFSSLRFPELPEQNWRATFWRIHPRDSRREYSWASVDREDPCQFCQYGKLTGVRGIQPGTALDLIPAITASQSSARSTPGNPAAPFTHGDIGLRPSLSVRWGITPSLLAEATVNPDFSQVESDEAQIDVNTTFALFYPERRPFFQEGSDLFNTSQNIVYTRTINDPLVAAKVTGRFGGTAVGYIGAYDRNTALITPFPDFTAIMTGDTGSGVAPIRSIVNIGRVRHTFNQDMRIGAIVTDRRLVERDGSNSTANIDGAIRFLDNYVLSGLVSFSSTVEPQDSTITSNLGDIRFDNGLHTARFDGEKFNGHALWLRISRAGRYVNADLSYSETSPSYRAPDGFITRNDRRELSGWAGYTFYPEHSTLLDNIQPNVAVGRIWTTAGGWKDGWIVPGIDVQFKGQTYVHIDYLWSSEVFRGTVVHGIRRVGGNFSSNFSQAVSLNGSGNWGYSMVRFTQVPTLGHGGDFSFGATLKPIDQLNLRLSGTYSTLREIEADTPYYSEWIGRVRANFQATRELSIRLVVQYIQGASRLSFEPLVTWRLNPFTIVYAGSSLAYNETPNDGFVHNERQLFAKVQYLWQL